jgi:uncharacterized protein YqeY
LTGKRQETIEKWGIAKNPFVPTPPSQGDEGSLIQKFTGRVDELGKICESIDPVRGILISGMFGSGKTILIQEAFRKLKSHDCITVYITFKPELGFRKTVLWGLAQALAASGDIDAELVLRIIKNGPILKSELKKHTKDYKGTIKIFEGAFAKGRETSEEQTLDIKNPLAIIEEFIKQIRENNKKLIIAVDDLERRGDITNMQQIIDDTREIIYYRSTIILTGHPIGVTSDLKTSAGGILTEIPLEVLPCEELVQLLKKNLNSERITKSDCTYPFDKYSSEFIANIFVKYKLPVRHFLNGCSDFFEKAASCGIEKITKNFLDKNFSIIAKRIYKNLEPQDKVLLKKLYNEGGVITEDLDKPIEAVGGEFAEYQEMGQIMKELITNEAVVVRYKNGQKTYEVNPIVMDNRHLFLD